MISYLQRHADMQLRTYCYTVIKDTNFRQAYHLLLNIFLALLLAAVTSIDKYST